MAYLTEKPIEAIHPWVAEGTRKVRMGVHFVDPYSDWQRSCDAVLAAEAMGFDSVWMADHPTLLADCWTVLSALATKTTTIRLGTLVNCIFYRHPVLLARMAVDVDRMSDGRLVLGIGIGDIPAEFQQLGIPYLSARERQEVLEETVQVVKELWGAEPVAFEGKHLQIQARLPVGPVQQPAIPVLIAGGGEKTTLRQVAQYAHVSNFGAHTFTGGAARVGDVKRKCLALQTHCQNRERDSRAILRSYISMPFILGKTPEIIERKLQAIPAGARQIFQSSIVALGPQEAITYFQGLMQAGMQYFIVGVSLRDRDTLELLQSEVLPALTALEG
jgi:alkanesulfonate monooxygenase SsuD/methylene tetrahydromethanopterin reductase-like flavin-dependent oxidoreductase (luciferase family)